MIEGVMILIQGNVDRQGDGCVCMNGCVKTRKNITSVELEAALNQHSPTRM